MTICIRFMDNFELHRILFQVHVIDPPFALDLLITLS
jgi:hypothetical protein